MTPAPTSADAEWRPEHLRRQGLALALGAFLIGVMGCPGSDPPEDEGEGEATGVPVAAAAEGTVENSWMFRAAQNPEILAPFEKKDSTGQAWLGIYHNDLNAAFAPLGALCKPSAEPLAARAAAGFPCVGLARIHLEKATTYAVAAEIDRIARRQFYAHRLDRPEEVLISVHEAYFSGVNLVLSGAAAEGETLLRTYAASEHALPLLATLARRISAGGSDPLISRIWGSSPDEAPADSTLGDLPDSPETAVYLHRLAVMVEVAQGNIDGALGMVQEVKVTQMDLQEELEQRTDGGETVKVLLSHFDSAYMRSLQRLHALAAKRAVGRAPELALLDVEAELLLGRSPTLPASAPPVVEGLAFVVFSSWPTPTDRLEAMRKGARPAVISRLGAADPVLLATAREKVSDLDMFVRLSNSVKDRLTTAIRTAGNANMDIGMGLSERFLGRLLIDGAHDIQMGTDTRLEVVEGKDMATAGVAARSLLEMAVDKNPSPPAQSLRRARLSFRNDPTLLVDLARAELDTKRPYYANDYIRPLTEVYPELIPVREGLTALDSAWNPMRAGAVR